MSCSTPVPPACWRRLRETPGVRGAGAPQIAHVRSRPSRTRVAGPPPDNARELLTLDSRQPIAGPAARGAALQVTVINGDLRFIRQPLLIGHYRSLRLSGTEAVMNGLIGGAMEESLKIGLYPVPTGTHQVFVNTQADPDNPWQPPRPEAVVVVGLGAEGELTPADLVHTVRQATIAWAQRMAETRTDAPALFEIAATLIGSGGTGITVGQSAQLVAQGVREADDRLREANENETKEREADRKRPARRWPRVGHLYLSRAVSRSRDRSLAFIAGAEHGHARPLCRRPTSYAPAPAQCGARSTQAIAVSTTTSSRPSRS